MITIALTYRNRELRIVKNCLKSLKEQSVRGFKVVLVDYGSTPQFSGELSVLVKTYNFIELIHCPVDGQLWNKSRAINIALKLCDTPYFLVGDIDLIFHPNFIKTAISEAKKNDVTYFQYGFLGKEESLLNKNFGNFIVDFKGNNEVTGTTLFPTIKLMELNGYDEFYHGWGAEDTDIHIRLKNIGLNIVFFDSEIMVKHQWHAKAYRSKVSTSPFHSKLERINHAYMNITDATKRCRVNLDNNWGIIPSKKQYAKLTNKPTEYISIYPDDISVTAVLSQFKNFKNELVQVNINETSIKIRIKECVKNFLGKKNKKYLPLDVVNNMILEKIIVNYRNTPYTYFYNKNKKELQLLILFQQ